MSSRATRSRRRRLRTVRAPRLRRRARRAERRSRIGAAQGAPIAEKRGKGRRGGRRARRARSLRVSFFRAGDAPFGPRAHARHRRRALLRRVRRAFAFRGGTRRRPYHHLVPVRSRQARARAFARSRVLGSRGVCVSRIRRFIGTFGRQIFGRLIFGLEKEQRCVRGSVRGSVGLGSHHLRLILRARGSARRRGKPGG